MRIGITIGITKEKESIWTNGIKLNAIFLSKALKRTGHDVTILDTGQALSKITQDNVDFDIKEFPTKKYMEVQNGIELMIMLGTSFETDYVKKWKHADPRRRVVKYHCGNNYVIDMERSIFPKVEPNKTGASAYQRGCIDEVWYVPQQGTQNKSYYAVLYDIPLEKVIPVPFVWDPHFLDRDCSIFQNRLSSGEYTLQEHGFPVYVPKKDKDGLRYCIMEPNHNVVKYATIPIMIVDLVKRGGRGIGSLNVMSSNHLIKNSYWKSIIKNLDIAKPGSTELRCHGRLPVIPTLAKYADFIVSHQWHNPLNYAYLDALYLQYPLIHNAEMLKDAGYYYPGFNIHDGAKKLEYAIKNHDVNLEKYNSQSEKVLERYTIYNQGLIDIYCELIHNLKYKKSSEDLSYEYDPKTNLYKK